MVISVLAVSIAKRAATEVWSHCHSHVHQFGAKNHLLSEGFLVHQDSKLDPRLANRKEMVQVWTLRGTRPPWSTIIARHRIRPPLTETFRTYWVMPFQLAERLRQDFHPRIVGLTGTPEQVKKALSTASKLSLFRR